MLLVSRMSGKNIMDKNFTCGRVAHLRLQSVVPICEKAISQFRGYDLFNNRTEIHINQDVSYNVYAWIDAELFIDTLIILFGDLVRCTRYDKSISVSVKRIGTSICRIVVACTQSVNFSECEGPLSISECPCHSEYLEDAQGYITMHGGYMQIWKNPASSECFFEINLICMSKNGESEYDTIEE
jgi:hypothetical protein